MQKLLFALLAFILISCGSVNPDGTVKESVKEKYANEIQVDDLKEHLFLLSSDILEGRKTGEKRQKMAVNYFTAYYEHLQLMAPELNPGYTQNIPQEYFEGRSNGPSQNILAYIEGSEFPNEVIVISAHYDHLGMKGEEVYNGADDNASGTAAMLEIAQYLVAQQKAGKLKMKRDIIFAAWSGEELGLIGSSYYVNNAVNSQDPHTKPALNKRLAACLNLDMVGRLNKNLVLQGIGSSSVWTGEIERRNVPVGLPIVTQKDTYLATDATSFYLRGVPILSAFTGAHEDYHSPRDTVDKINFEGTQKISHLMALIARGLITKAEAPDYVKVDPPKNKGSRGGLRAYLGTVPDYAQGDMVGVKLSDVAQTGPAAKAGIKSGDVIVKLGDKDVKNIYDYTYVIGDIKIGEEIEIVVLRDGKRVKLKITPGSRD